MAYFDNIPHAMRERSQWMLTDRNKAPLAWDWGEERTYAGSKNRPDQFLSFATARALAEQEGLLIGYVPLSGDPFTIIDLDFKEDKVYDADADSIKKSLLNGAHGSTYIESSLSGKGYHIVVKGKLPHDFNVQKVGIECYGNLGFVVMTGRMPEACVPIEPSDQQPVLDWIAAKYPTAVQDAAFEDAKLDKQQINNPPLEELALDAKFAEWTDSWRNRENIDSWMLDNPGDDRSAVDLKVMQLFVAFTRERKFPDESAIRMFYRCPRGKLLSRKVDPNQYVTRTLVQAKARVALDAKRSKDFDFSAGTHAMIEAFKAQIEGTKQIEAPQPAQMIANSPIAPGVTPPAPFKGFSWLTKRDIENAPALEWAVKGLYPIGGLGAIYGESGAGKSFVGIDLIAAMAEGKRWFNMRTKQLPVSVFALEGEGGLKGRVKAWEIQNKREYPESVLFWDSARNGSFALRDGDPRSDENKTRLVQLCADLNASGRRGGVVVIDTLNQASDGADENSSRDMGELLRAMKLIQRETGSLVLIVHHSTKSKENQSMRGHSSLYGAMDGIMEVIRDVYTEDEQPRLIEHRRGWVAKKVKDGRDGYTKLFDMKEHQVGFDEDGPVMSIAIEPVSDSIVDEQTGEILEVVNTGTLKAPAPNRSGGVKRNGSAKRAGSGEAPPVTRPRNQPTYSDAEHAAPPPMSNAQNSEQRANRYDIGSVLTQALALGADRVQRSNMGKFGAPAGKHPTPRKEFIQIITDLINPDEIDAAFKKAVDNALSHAVRYGKLGRSTDNGIQYFWALDG